MTEEQKAIREQQRETWDKFSPGWKKWDSLTMEFLHPMGDAIVHKLNLKETDVVLDVATGTGEPGLTIAGIVKNGKVVASDLSEGMLKIAAENAAARGLTNFETVASDVCALPFEDNTFDAISCRFGFMFFPDMHLALSEMVRVLKPGGRLATSVWDGPEKNNWITTTMGTINRIMDLQPPPPGAPGMFRCAKDGFMADMFSSAGLKNVAHYNVSGKLMAGSPDRYWSLNTEVAAPVVGAMAKADDATKKKIKDEVYSLLAEKFPDGNVMMDSAAIVIYGEKD